VHLEGAGKGDSPRKSLVPHRRVADVHTKALGLVCARCRKKIEVTDRDLDLDYPVCNNCKEKL